MLPIIAALALSILGSPTRAPTTAPTVAPTAASVNADISKAVAAGKTSYTFTSNRIALEAPIVVPAGTRNFALLGRKGGTVLTAKTGIGYAITAGVQANYKNWPLDGYPSAAVENVPDRALSVTQDGTLSVKVGDYLELWDAQWVTHTNGQDSQQNRAEIVHVAKVDGKTITFDKPVSREYDLVPKVTQITPQVIVNLDVEGISFDAAYPGGKNSGVLSVGLVSGLICRDLTTTNFGSRSISVNIGSDLLFERVVTRFGADIGNPGSGYGPTLMKSHRFRFVDCESQETRHGFMATNGSTDGVYENCRSLGTNGNFDTHGFDERRISWIGCTTDGNLNIGNTAYLAGGSNFLVKDCKLGYSVLVSAGVKHVLVVNTDQWGVAWQSTNTAAARPQGVPASDVLYKNCRFKFAKSFVTETGDVTGLVFDGCDIESGTEPYTQLMALKWTTGTIAFRDTTIRMLNAGVYTPIVLSQTNASTFRLTLDNVTFTTVGAPWSAVQLAKGFRGSVVARDSFIQTSRKGALFIDNQGAVNPPVLASTSVRP